MEKFFWDKERFFEELEHDEEEIRELLEVYVSSSKRLLSEIKKALEAGDLETVRRSSHSLKGASATIFLESVRVLALNLEKASDIKEAHNLFLQLKEQLHNFWQNIAAGVLSD